MNLDGLKTTVWLVLGSMIFEMNNKETCLYIYQVISFMSFKLHEENGRGELLHSQTLMLLKVVLTVIC